MIVATPSDSNRITVTYVILARQDVRLQSLYLFHVFTILPTCVCLLVYSCWISCIAYCSIETAIISSYCQLCMAVVIYISDRAVVHYAICHISDRAVVQYAICHISDRAAVQYTICHISNRAAVHYASCHISDRAVVQYAICHIADRAAVQNAIFLVHDILSICFAIF